MGIQIILRKPYKSTSSFNSEKAQVITGEVLPPPFSDLFFI